MTARKIAIDPGFYAIKAALRGGDLAAGLDMAGATEVADQSDLIDALGDWQF
jgi:hypothetical protein